MESGTESRCLGPTLWGPSLGTLSHPVPKHSSEIFIGSFTVLLWLQTAVTHIDVLPQA